MTTTPKTVTLYSTTGYPFVIAPMSPTDAATVKAAIEAAWGSGHPMCPYSLPGSPERRVNLAIVGYYTVV